MAIRKQVKDNISDYLWATGKRSLSKSMAVWIIFIKCWGKLMLNISDSVSSSKNKFSILRVYLNLKRTCSKKVKENVFCTWSSDRDSGHCGIIPLKLFKDGCWSTLALMKKSVSWVSKMASQYVGRCSYFQLPSTSWPKIKISASILASMADILLLFP